MKAIIMIETVEDDLEKDTADEKASRVGDFKRILARSLPMELLCFVRLWCYGVPEVSFCGWQLNART
jgi:hypothetical protein